MKRKPPSFPSSSSPSSLSSVSGSNLPRPYIAPFEMLYGTLNGTNGFTPIPPSQVSQVSQDSNEINSNSNLGNINSNAHGNKGWKSFPSLSKFCDNVRSSTSTLSISKTQQYHSQSSQSQQYQIPSLHLHRKPTWGSLITNNGKARGYCSNSSTSSNSNTNNNSNSNNNNKNSNVNRKEREDKSNQNLINCILSHISFTSYTTMTLIIFMITIHIVDYCAPFLKLTDNYFTTPIKINLQDWRLFDLFRIFSYIIGHADFDHLWGNASQILILGNLIEEKYGSGELAKMILITALIGSMANFLVNGFNVHWRGLHYGYSIRGASGIVYSFWVLASVVGNKHGKIPLELLLVLSMILTSSICNFYWNPSTNISHMGHVIGGITGGILGLFYSKKVR